MKKLALTLLLAGATITIVIIIVGVVFEALKPTEGERLAIELAVPSIDAVRALHLASTAAIDEARDELDPQALVAWRDYVATDTATIASALGPDDFCRAIDSFESLGAWPDKDAPVRAACDEHLAVVQRLAEIETANRDSARERDAANADVTMAEARVAAASEDLAAYITASIWIYGSLGEDVYEVSEIIGRFPGGQRYVLHMSTTEFTTTGRATITMRGTGPETVTLNNGNVVTWGSFREASGEEVALARRVLQGAQEELRDARQRLDDAPRTLDTGGLQQELANATQAVTAAAKELANSTHAAPVNDETKTTASHGAAAPDAHKTVSGSFRELSAADDELARAIFSVACATDLRKGEAPRDWLVCDRRSSVAGTDEGSLILRRAWAGKPSSTEAPVAVLAIEDDSAGFNFMNDSMFVVQEPDGAWTLAKYDSSIDASGCELVEQAGHQLICFETTSGGGSSENLVFALQTDGTVVSLWGWETSERVGGQQARYLGATIADVAGDEVPEIVLTFQTKESLPLRRTTEVLARSDDPGQWWEERKFALAFHLNDTSASRHAIDDARLRTAGLSEFGGAVAAPDASAQASAYLDDLQPNSQAAYNVFRRRIAALHNLQETSRLESLGSDLLRKFPEHAEQTLRDVLRACFDARDEACVQRLRVEAVTRGYNFDSKLAAWRVETAAFTRIPKTPHKVPGAWREAGVPTGEITPAEKLHAVEDRAVEASRNGDHERAEGLARWLVNFASDDAQRLDFLLTLGKIFERAAQEERARALYLAMVRAHPSNAKVVNRAAWFLLTAKNADVRAPTRGTKLAETAAALALDDPSVLDTLAEAMIRAENPARARELLQRCVALDPLRTYYAERLANLAQ